MRSAAVLLVVACSPNGPRDVADPRAKETTQVAPPSEGYEYVVKKPHGVIALAESRGVPKESARAAMDRLANDFEACLAELAKRGQGRQGAARVVLPLDVGGAPLQPLVKVSEGSDATATTILCVVAPAKMLAFPVPTPTEAGAPGLAIEASWPP